MGHVMLFYLYRDYRISRSGPRLSSIVGYVELSRRLCLPSLPLVVSDAFLAGLSVRRHDYLAWNRLLGSPRDMTISIFYQFKSYYC